MTLPAARLFGLDREEITDLDSWHAHAPPESDKEWREGYGSREQANAWLRGGAPAVPEELWSAMAGAAGETDEVFARPEHRTAVDQPLLFACARRGGETSLAVGVEARGCEDFGGAVGDRTAEARRRARCNELARALFGRPVVDEELGSILDRSLAGHGYRLWAAAVGTILEAQQRGVADAMLVVHQFSPRDVRAALGSGDKRGWAMALRANEAAFETFAAELERSGSSSHATEHVQAGTRLHLARVDTPI